MANYLRSIKCPRCFSKTFTSKKEAIATAKNSYGNVTADTYHENLTKAKNLPEATKIDNDFILYQDELVLGVSGLFYVKFSGKCQRCGFNFDYSHSQQLNLD